mmetsp:Transcript_2180/g.6350  ORF Transcript_2180/g.6350 Transcript_2180/m.6350 type:complete len:131 (-) Transcript_2180:213-605(-)
MRSSHARRPTNHLLLVASTAAAACAAATVAVTVMLIRRRSRSSNRHKGGDGKGGTKNHESLENEDASPSTGRKSESTRFPWEPSSGDNDIGKGQHISTYGEARNEDQLDFLASMTFASSGLRQPSCPCCV